MTNEAIKQVLAEMESDKALVTKPGYLRGLTDIRLLPFEEWHLKYLLEHPKINAANYLTNLRVMLRSRVER